MPAAQFASVHLGLPRFQFRISGMSWPCRTMYSFLSHQLQCDKFSRGSFSLSDGIFDLLVLNELSPESRINAMGPHFGLGASSSAQEVPQISPVAHHVQ
jgi:hypothetical protein